MRRKSGSQTLGNIVKNTRKARGMTGKVLAEKIGVHRAHISKIEHAVHLARFSIIKKISLALESPEIIEVFIQEAYPEIYQYFEERIRNEKIRIS